MPNADAHTKYSFDSSRMKVLGDESKLSSEILQGLIVVLMSEDVLAERPGLEAYRIAQQPSFATWSGNDPPPVYVKLPDDETYRRYIGPTTVLAANDIEVAGASIAAAVGVASGVATARAVGAVVQPHRARPAETARLRRHIRATSWTGIEERIAAIPGAIDAVNRLVVELDILVEKCGLTNFEQQRAKALTGALVSLVSSPQPDWQIIVQVLNSPVFNALWRLKEVAVLLATIVLFLVGRP